MEDKKKELSEISYELITRKYLFYKSETSRVFSIPEYIAIHIMVDSNNKYSIYEGKTYLRDIAEKMHLTIRQTSNLMNGLKDKGFVKWSHDGDGSNGTFVVITDEGIELFEQEKEILENFYQRVINKFGTANLLKMLNLMKQFETIVSSEMECDTYGTEFE